MPPPEADDLQAGSAHLQAGRFDAAAARFRTAAELAPASPQAHLLLGIARYLRSGPPKP